MNISVIVCTKDRAAALRRCLDQIFRIGYDQPWEIIVVDNGSTDETPALIEEMAARSPVPFRSVVERTPGNSAGRNAGIRIADGEIIFFTDDDCIVDIRVLDEMWSIFRDARIGFAGGRIQLFNSKDYPVALMDEPDAIAIPPRSMVYPGLVQGSNMAFRRKALLESGGFDPAFGAGTPFAGEELELATRMSQRGWHGGYFPGPLVLHNHGRGRAQAMKSEKQYDIGIGAYYGKFLFDDATRWRCAPIWLRRSAKQLFRHPLGLPRQLLGAIRYARVRSARQPDNALS